MAMTADPIFQTEPSVRNLFATCLEAFVVIERKLQQKRRLLDTSFADSNLNLHKFVKAVSIESKVGLAEFSSGPLPLIER